MNLARRFHDTVNGENLGRVPCAGGTSDIRGVPSAALGASSSTVLSPASRTTTSLRMTLYGCWLWKCC